MTEETPKLEWKDITPDIPLRQGDLLVVRNRKTRAIEKMAVVITADCDIDKNKFGPQMACLNIQFHETYIRTTWAERSLESAKDKALAKITEKIRSLHSRMIGEPSIISAESIEAWLTRADLVSIASELSVAEAELKGFMEFVSPCHAALQALNKLESTDPFEQLKVFTAANKRISIEEARAEILRSARDATLPSDVILLPGFPGEPNKMIVILLRELVGVPIEFITTRQSEALDDHYYLRVGRLRSTFKFSLSQSFGALYSKIGLPGAYETRRKNALNGTLSYEWN